MKSYKLLLETIHGPTNIGKDTSISHLHDSLSKHYHFPEHSDQNHIFDYTFKSKHLNGYLHKAHDNKLTDEDHDYDHDYHAENLSDAITQHPAPHDLHVYSGLHKAPMSPIGLRNQHQEHDKAPIKAILPAFTSASVAYHVARNFAHYDHVLKIHISAGSKHGAYIGHISQHPEEKEFLIDKGKKIHIHHEPEIQNGYHIWHAKIVE